MSMDMFPDSAVDYIVLHSKCPPDHSTCTVEEEEASVTGDFDPMTEEERREVYGDERDLP